MTALLHLIVSGKVQGVSFRAHTQKKALELKLTGFVKNLPDGRVEITAYGSKKNLEHLLKWAKKGPNEARVDHIENHWQEPADSDYSTFIIQY